MKEVSNELKKQGIKISPDSLAKYERADREPKLETWQKPADFFGASVPYLQGLTYSKDDILEILNNAYMADKLDKQPSLEDDRIELVTDKYLWSENITPPNKIFRTEQLMNYRENPKVIAYWSDNFSFLFSTSSINDFMMNGGNKLGLKIILAREIEKQYLKANETEISKYFSNNIYPYLNAFNLLKDDLVRFGSDDEIKKYIDELIVKLKDFEKELDELPPNPKKQFLE